mmetsp:Transcript_5161/g.15239  ORF Transcript_5161/g.15239 Transcript_5161/m.15239 type:complete len:232 (-) Transcript_5161:79-774(-)
MGTNYLLLLLLLLPHRHHLPPQQESQHLLLSSLPSSSSPVLSKKPPLFSSATSRLRFDPAPSLSRISLSIANRALPTPRRLRLFPRSTRRYLDSRFPDATCDTLFAPLGTLPWRRTCPRCPGVFSKRVVGTLVLTFARPLLPKATVLRLWRLSSFHRPFVFRFARTRESPSLGGLCCCVEFDVFVVFCGKGVQKKLSSSSFVGKVGFFFFHYRILLLWCWWCFRARDARSS